ncbi:putative signal transducing protein [Winogradskyella ursingii]|uniref:putative signal transducing protein n=1 Tax=Winogradskyella ursingii TaxID=2686079 RepID=UPI0015C7714C|nr:DUF2007 domain-containing protein [Winogradskyella ursingii]
MSGSEYRKVFYGSFIIATRVKNELEQIGITPIIKDEGESQRLAGYGSMTQGYQDVLVHQDEYDKAMEIVNRIQGEMEKPE